MIGQIDIEKSLQLQPNKECLFVSLATVLNHVVDAVNELQATISKMENVERSKNVQPDAETRSENVQDKLERTRKVLDRAKWWLHEIVENHRYTPISTAEMALKEITALEQKE